MKLLLIALTLTSAGCMSLGTQLGAHYKHFERHGETFVSCTVVARADRPKLAADALRVCQEAIQENPPDYIGHRGKLDQRPSK